MICTWYRNNYNDWNMDNKTWWYLYVLSISTPCKNINPGDHMQTPDSEQVKPLSNLSSKKQTQAYISSFVLQGLRKSCTTSRSQRPFNFWLWLEASLSLHHESLSIEFKPNMRIISKLELVAALLQLQLRITAKPPVIKNETMAGWVCKLPFLIVKILITFVYDWFNLLIIA